MGELANPEERWLHHAYELGRCTLNHNFRLLDLILLHHRSLAEMLSDRSNCAIPDWTDPATLFLTECLSSFEMTLQGYHEIKGRLEGVDGALAQARKEIQAAQAALTAEVAERHRGEMLRQAQRLEIITRISGGIAHHFNSPDGTGLGLTRSMGSRISPEALSILRVTSARERLCVCSTGCGAKLGTGGRPTCPRRGERQGICSWS